MAKKQKEELFEKEITYCKIIRGIELKDGDEIRLCFYRDYHDRTRKLIPNQLI